MIWVATLNHQLKAGIGCSAGWKWWSEHEWECGFATLPQKLFIHTYMRTKLAYLKEVSPLQGWQLGRY